MAPAPPSRWAGAGSCAPRLLPALALVAAIGCAAPDTDDAVAARPSVSIGNSALPAAPREQPSVTVSRTTQFGTSAQGRALFVTEIGDPTSSHRLLVVGCVHGNEPAGTSITDVLSAAPALRGADLWIIGVLNPDGVAAGTRQNANGVDLNRNFPFDWQRIGQRGAVDYSGSAALSEPESMAFAKLVRQIQPTTTIWFHQHAAVVDNSQGPLGIEAQFARLVGLPLARLTDYPGSAVGWEDAVFGPTAFVVELPGGDLTATDAEKYAAAVRAVAESPAP